MRCAIAFSCYSVSANLGLAVFQGNIADLRKEFDFLIK
jgi:hypothetical protein